MDVSCPSFCLQAAHLYWKEGSAAAAGQPPCRGATRRTLLASSFPRPCSLLSSIASAGAVHRALLLRRRSELAFGRFDSGSL